LSDASSAEDYIAVYIRIEVASIHPGNLFFFETVMAYCVARANGKTVTAMVAQFNIDGTGLAVNDTPHTHDTVTDAEHTFTALVFTFFNSH
jgi:hypothetical protein